MPENSLLMNAHHVGSAPAVHPPNWDRRRGYPGEMIEALGFQPGSAESMGFPGSPHLHELKLNSMFSQTERTFIESMSPAHIGTPSPRQRGHMIPHPSSFDSPGDRMRSRRNESSANQSDDKRQFELDIQRIARGEDTRTTLMIKNIPNKYLSLTYGLSSVHEFLYGKLCQSFNDSITSMVWFRYTSKMLLAAIDETHRGTYDFIYLPIDFKASGVFLYKQNHVNCT
jgi:hypothetical protein